MPEGRALTIVPHQNKRNAVAKLRQLFVGLKTTPADTDLMLRVRVAGLLEELRLIDVHPASTQKELDLVAARRVRIIAQLWRIKIDRDIKKALQ